MKAGSLVWMPAFVVTSLLVLPVASGVAETTLKPQALTEVPRPLVQSYRITHGSVVAGAFAPYAREYLEATGHDPALVMSALDLPPAERSPADVSYAWPISSDRYCCGSWTHFRGEEVRIFEVIELTGGGPTFLTVLYNIVPSGLMFDDFDAHASGWRLALIGDLPGDTKTFDLTAVLPVPRATDEFGEESVWPWGDMVTTDLRSAGTVRVRVRYQQTGHAPAQPAIAWELAVTADAVEVLAVEYED